MEYECELCSRLKELTFHHYIPKTLHNNKLFKKIYDRKYMQTHGINLCDDCHSAIHNFFTEKELGKKYNDKNKLLSTEKVRNFLKWIKKQK
jgi:hypothetical protein